MPAFSRCKFGANVMSTETLKVNGWIFVCRWRGVSPTWGFHTLGT